MGYIVEFLASWEFGHLAGTSYHYMSIQVIIRGGTRELLGKIEARIQESKCLEMVFANAVCYAAWKHNP